MQTQTLLLLAGSIALASTSAIPRRDTTDPGVDLANMSSKEQTFYFCDNASNGEGTADPGFTSGTNGCSHLVTSVAVAPSATTTLSLPATFTGRIARSTLTPATWVEIQLSNGGGTAWGDISLEIGCDGAAEIAPATGGGNAEKVGFASPVDIVEKAPSGATTTRSDGVTVVDVPWSVGSVVNQAAADYLEGAVPGGNKMAYITGVDETKVTTSSNNRLAIWFY